jgi:hypothetical protein
MAAPMTQATYVNAAVSAATTRGITDADELRRIRLDAADFWQTRLNQSYSGAPSGSATATN